MEFENCDNLCDCETFYGVLNLLRSNKQGQYYDNVKAACIKIGWSEEKVKTSLEMGVKHDVLKDVIYKNNISYRIIAKDSINITIKDHVNNRDSNCIVARFFRNSQRKD